ncbi:hypothetical protein ACLM5H_22540 [Fredinandcohnia humi]
MRIKDLLIGILGSFIVGVIYWIIIGEFKWHAFALAVVVFLITYFITKFIRWNSKIYGQFSGEVSKLIFVQQSPFN